VSGFGEEFEGKVEAQNLDATKPEAVKRVKSLGFKNHGLVITDAEGKVLFKQPDHQVKVEEVRAELTKLLESKN